MYYDCLRVDMCVIDKQEEKRRGVTLSHFVESSLSHFFFAFFAFFVIFAFLDVDVDSPWELRRFVQRGVCLQFCTFAHTVYTERKL